MPDDSKYPVGASRYDKIIRENMRYVAPCIAQKVLKLDIAEMKVLPDKIHVTRQKETDSLWEVTDRRGRKYLLQLEFQTSDDPFMPLRMLVYRSTLMDIYKLPVEQYVIYLGESRTAMVNRIDEPGLTFEYHLISLRDIPSALFLSSERPEERLLAVPGDFEGAEPTEVIETVLKSVAGPEPHGLEGNKYFEQLRVMIQLRNLAKQYREAMVKVASFFKVERDALYQMGEERGVEKGIEKGIEKGAEGKSYEVVRNMLLSGRFTVAEIITFANVTDEFVYKVKADLNRN